MSRFSILATSDLSDRSERALRRAFKLARELDADLTLFAVADDSLPEDVSGALANRSREYLEAFAKEADAGLNRKIIVELGDPTTRLAEMANDPSFDLVIFGRHRPDRFLDGFRKTTVESIASLALTPLLIVVNPSHKDYRRVLAPTAFSRACSRAVETAIKIAPDAELRMIHAWSAPFEGRTGGKDSDYAKTVAKEITGQAEAWSSSLPAAVPGVDLVHGGLGQTVAQSINSFQPELLTIGAHTRSVSISGLGSFTSELVRDPPTDLLITR